MKRLPKRPRTFGRTKAKPHQKKQKWDDKVFRDTFAQEDRHAKGRMDDNVIALMNELSPGFAEWYRRNYDEQGMYIGNEIETLFGTLSKTEEKYG